MSDNILVVEYEPRYTDRVKQALSGQPYDAVFVKDGEEALSTLDKRQPRLIVMSSVLPRISAPELIRLIRNRSDFKGTPILVTVSGYNGKSTKADAMKLGASDILPKPYSEGEFLGKVKQLLGGASNQTVQLDLRELGLLNPKPAAAPPGGGQKLTSDDIFGDMVDDKNPAAIASRKSAKASQDLDDMLSQTLSGVRAVKKKPEDQRPDGQAAPTPSTPAVPKPAKPRSTIDDLVQNTLSGLEKQNRPRPAAEAPVAAPPPATPRVAPVAAAPQEVPARPSPAAAPRPAPTPPPTLVDVPLPQKVTISAPIIVPRVEPEKHDEKEKEDVDGIRFGQYVLKEKIATGGMAEVWKARMRGVEGFQKMVAIKKILPHMSDNEEFVTMFIDEAKLAAQLNHNNIIHIYDLGKIASSFYIAMEFIDGRDLKAILKRGEDRGQPMTIELALFITSKIASALDYAHRKRDFDEKEMGLVHRDVSPQNVLISYEGDIKLCDFGIAKAASKASHTIAGALKGKLQYMSPEQARGKNIDRRSDIFALAVVLFEMLTGRKLFTGESEMSILEQVREGQVQTPSHINDEVTPEIDHIVHKALEKNADDRYQTAGEMARDLDAVLYSFRPTPTSADLAIFMHRIYGGEDEVVAPVEEVAAPPAPAVVAPPPPQKVTPHVAAAAPVHVAALVPVAVSSSPEPTFSFGVPAEEKKAPVALIAIGVLVAAAVIGGVVMATRKSSPASPVNSPAQTASIPAATTSVGSTAAPVVPTTTVTTATTGTALGQNDQALINEEVKKRLAQEKARLDLQKATQTAALAKPPETRPAAPTLPTPAPATQTIAAQPTPAPPPPAATQTVAEARPEPAAPAAARVKEGDLVEQGAEGLEPPQLIKLSKMQYPPMAKAQKVQGLVVVRALVSETGKVLEIKVLRGVAQNVGINEAAAEAVRSSAFRPATKDGVHVKSYYTMTIPFKL
ncbi:MAG TPA: TonB family protein [Thermoanaerobaculia bacterium]|nr:TonB family protein [Thermoanaerobaculia bacterium]